MPVIDSHVYTFEPLDSARGYASSEDHMRWLQAAYAGHHQPAMRIPDGAPGDSSVLDPGGRHQMDKLPDLKFRLNKPRGRLVWNWEGAEYTKYYFPPNLKGGEYTPFSLDSEMHYAGVEYSLVHTDPMLVRDSSYLKEVVEQFPRLRSMLPVDEWRIIPETDAVIRETVRAVKEHGLHAIKFNTSLCYMASDEPWDDGPYRPYWEAATELGVPVFFTLGSGPMDVNGSKPTKKEAQQGYIEELRTVMRWMERYPNNVCSLTHGFPYRAFMEGDRIPLPKEVFEPFQSENCNMEVCFPIRIGDLFDYPYREVWPTLEQMVEHIGPDHLLWGTDMPFQNRFCTYRQSRQWIEKHFAPATGLGKADLAKIMGDTAARILGIEA